MKIVLTGGTFCKSYCPHQGSMIFDRDKVLEAFSDIVKFVRFINKPKIVVWDLVDSREMKISDREDLYCFCESLNDDNNIVIVHGTDMMEHTVEYFSKKYLSKTFVFTGSWIPLVHDKSDAMFNLGYAMACANYKKKGAYIAMNGHCFADDVKKNWRALKYYKG
jgi:L-asparaginase